MDPIHSEEINGIRVEIYPDENPESPREWDNLGTMVCFHNRYNLGDVQPTEKWPEHFLSLMDTSVGEKIEAWKDAEYWKRVSHLDGDAFFKAQAELGEDVRERILEAFEETHIVLPLYLYDHSGITMNTTGFYCPWDSGQVGWIYVAREDALKEHNRKIMSKKLRATIMRRLEAEVETYDQYLRGDVYGYVIKRNDEVEDSCWGFYGEDDCIKEARRVAS